MGRHLFAAQNLHKRVDVKSRWFDFVATAVTGVYHDSSLPRALTPHFLQADCCLGEVSNFRMRRDAGQTGTFVAIQPVACAPRLPRNKKVNTNPARNPPMCAM